MLKQLNKCTTLKNFEDLAVSILIKKEESVDVLLKQILDNNLVFQSEDYWSSDIFEGYSTRSKAVKSLLSKCVNENESTRTLHLLQLLKFSCPIVSSVIDDILRRTTC